MPFDVSGFDRAAVINNVTLIAQAATENESDEVPNE
jgi:hypothetical protein